MIFIILHMLEIVLSTLHVVNSHNGLFSRY